MASITLKLGGTTTTNIVALRGTLTKRGTNTCRIKLKEDNASSLAYAVGDTVLLTVAGTDIFGGRIQSILQVLPLPRVDTASSDEILHVIIEARSYDERTKRRVIEAVTYQNMTTSAIMEDIVDNYLDGDGFAKTGIDSGGTSQAEVVYRGVTVFDAFNDLADREGWYWLVEPDGNIVFEDPSTTAAPFNVTDRAELATEGGIVLTTEGGAPITREGATNKPIWDLRVQNHLNQYANSILVVGAAGAAQSVSVTEEIYVEDTDAASLTSLSLNHPVHTITSVTKKITDASDTSDDTAYTVGILGNDADADKQILYERGSPTLTLNGVALAYGDLVEVVYTSPQTLLVQVDDASAISARQTAEGGSGRYEKAISGAAIDNTTDATSLANAVLAEATTLPQSVSYDTAQDGLLPGQVQTLTLSKRNLSGSYFVETVAFRQAAITGTNTYRMEYTVGLENRTGESLDQFAARWLRDRQVDDEPVGDGATNDKRDRVLSQNIHLRVYEA